MATLCHDRDDTGLALLANTECYPAGCREDMVKEEFGFRMSKSSEPAAALTPISILVRELNDEPRQSPDVQEARLIEGFERFTAGLDLGPLLTAATGNRTRGTQPPFAQR